MRPDEHKAKASRRYQSKHKKQGDTASADVAQARRQAAKAKVSGIGITAIRRRNGEFEQSTNTATVAASAEPESPVSDTRRFSRRKITTNRDRYEEISVEGSHPTFNHCRRDLAFTTDIFNFPPDQIKEDAELGIDRETTDLVRMLEEQGEF
jgi:hypothetical protein